MRAVLVPIAHGYGSTVRLLAVANELRKRRHEAAFAVAESIGRVVRQYGFEASNVVAVPIDHTSDVPPIVQVLRGEAAGDFLERQVEDVRRVIRDFQADVVIFSNNNAAGIAAGVEDRPTVSVFHPSVMQYYDLQSGVAVVLKWRRFFALKSRFELRREVPSSLLGDLNFIPSIPPLARWPFTQPPEILFRRRPVKTIGALLRTAPEELPDQETLKREFGVEGEPFVYASIGGAVADPVFLRAIADGLRISGRRALLTVGGERPTGPGPDELVESLSAERVKVIRFLPEAMRAIKACDVLVWHGGHETMMEAVAAARPAIGIPFQHDQLEHTSRLAEAGAALRIPREQLSAKALADAIEEVLANNSYAEQARRLKRINDSLGGVVRLVDSTEALVYGGRRI